MTMARMVTVAGVLAAVVGVPNVAAQFRDDDDLLNCIGNHRFWIGSRSGASQVTCDQLNPMSLGCFAEDNGNSGFDVCPQCGSCFVHTPPPVTSSPTSPTVPPTSRAPTTVAPTAPTTNSPTVAPSTHSPSTTPCLGDNTCTARVQSWRSTTTCDGPSNVTNLGNCQSFYDPDARRTVWTLVSGSTNGMHFCVFTSALTCSDARQQENCNGYPPGQCIPIRTLGSCEQNDDDDQTADDGNGPGSNIVILTCNGQTVPTTRAPTSNAPVTHSPTSFAPTTVAPTSVAPSSRPPYWNLNQPGVVTTYAPVTIAPTMLAPTSIAPTTVAPTTHAPTQTRPPTSASPVGSSASSSGPSTGLIAGAVVGAVVVVAVVIVVMMKHRSGGGSATNRPLTFNNPVNQEFGEVDDEGSVQAPGQDFSEFDGGDTEA